MQNLLTSQANAVLIAIAEAGLDPKDFEWSEVPSAQYRLEQGILVDKLSYGEDYYFLFDNNDAFFCRYAPARDRPYIAYGDAGSWEKQFEHVKNWLSYLAREVQSPDLWATVRTEQELLNAGIADDNSTFSEVELEDIRKALIEIKEFLITGHNFDKQLVEPQLRYLAESAERLGRKDWKNLMLGVVTNLVISAAAPPETVQAVFRFVGTALKFVLQNPGLLPAVTP